jgi:hypothetical protein
MEPGHCTSKRLALRDCGSCLHTHIARIRQEDKIGAYVLTA